jgi:unsaturated chondroitin disaccharide hydrolase
MGHFSVEISRLPGSVLSGNQHPYNTCRGEGVDECVSWGDYYYFEALTRLTGSWSTYW